MTVYAFHSWPIPEHPFAHTKEMIRKRHNEDRGDDEMRSPEMEELYEHTIDMIYRTWREEDALEWWQNGRCAICGRRDPRLVCDHDHRTLLIRGWLCRSCNTLEGYGRFPEYRERTPADVLGIVALYQSSWGSEEPPTYGPQTAWEAKNCCDPRWPRVDDGDLFTDNASTGLL